MAAAVLGATVSSVHDTVTTPPRLPAASTAVTNTSIRPSLGATTVSVWLLPHVDDPSSAVDAFTRSCQHVRHCVGCASPPQPVAITAAGALEYDGVCSVASVTGGIVSTIQATVRGWASTCPTGSVVTTITA